MEKSKRTIKMRPHTTRIIAGIDVPAKWYRYIPGAILVICALWLLAVLGQVA